MGKTRSLLTDEGKDKRAKGGLMKEEGTDEDDLTGISPRYLRDHPHLADTGQQVVLHIDSSRTRVSRNWQRSPEWRRKGDSGRARMRMSWKRWP